MISYPDTESPGTAQGCSFIPVLHLPSPGPSCRASAPGSPEAASPLSPHGPPGGRGPSRRRDCPVPYNVWGETQPPGVAEGALTASTEKYMLEK